MQAPTAFAGLQPAPQAPQSSSVVAVPEAVVARDGATASRTRRHAVHLAADLAAHEAVFGRAEARFAGVRLRSIAVGVAVGTLGRRAPAAAAHHRRTDSAAAPTVDRVRAQIGFAAIVRAAVAFAATRRARPGAAHAVDALTRDLAGRIAGAATRPVGEGVLAESTATGKTRWTRFVFRATRHTARGVTDRPRCALGVIGASGAGVSRDITGESTAVGISCTTDATAVVRLAVGPLRTTIELVFAVGQTLDAITTAGVTNGRRGKMGAVPVAPAHRGSGRRRRARVLVNPGIRRLVGNELVVLDAAGRCEQCSEQQREKWRVAPPKSKRH
jgi:hypothetical protein